MQFGRVPYSQLLISSKQEYERFTLQAIQLQHFIDLNRIRGGGGGHRCDKNTHRSKMTLQPLAAVKILLRYTSYLSSCPVLYDRK
jgi:hypothetical protein